MIQLKFNGFLTSEDKDFEFEDFRENVSKIFSTHDNLMGEIIFEYYHGIRRFEIKNNNTSLTHEQILILLGEENQKYLV